MVVARKILSSLKKNGIDFFTGVPDSVLKNFSHLLYNYNKKKHIIAANEGGAVAIAVGYYLSSKKIPLVYLQNSGLGNIVNPITSMAHNKIYGIPMLLFIGWRGSPGIQDEIQHKVQGNITLKQLKLLNIKYEIFNKKTYTKQIKKLVNFSKARNQPVAYLFRLNDLNKDKIKIKIKNNNQIKRADFLRRLIEYSKKSIIVASTGFTSRELYHIRQEIKFNKNRDFYLVGAMGHTAMVSLGISLKTKKNIICLDGDGSFLMHMGSIFISSAFGSNNFKYILLNNECHEFVGKQPTSINKVNLKLFTKSIGFQNYELIIYNSKINKTLKKFMINKGPSFLEVKIKNGTLDDLKRIKDLNKIKNNFMN